MIASIIAFVILIALYFIDINPNIAGIIVTACLLAVMITFPEGMTNAVSMSYPMSKVMGENVSKEDLQVGSKITTIIILGLLALGVIPFDILKGPDTGLGPFKLKYILMIAHIGLIIVTYVDTISRVQEELQSFDDSDTKEE